MANLGLGQLRAEAAAEILAAAASPQKLASLGPVVPDVPAGLALRKEGIFPSQRGRERRSAVDGEVAARQLRRSRPAGIAAGGRHDLGQLGERVLRQTAIGCDLAAINAEQGRGAGAALQG